ncbi:hypothetical protein CEUSTIGMA_g3438.t1 [Chlamydomonas eustigma]|uniref:Uncharacterized protein n=1 Tax=Chlamydomonas eustigma TaxID=1157962 RepID=A0A250WYY6_9CHLO|nr:hypothetical protein CEUSTIGMA_g3438.t1 [Chlamydomonas eustigma]|eukprot:GAX75995.1 hypothetical protein CEUSTIGMA_g3438.t1 [Chlamydomonas eustigma]
MKPFHRSQNAAMPRLQASLSTAQQHRTSASSKKAGNTPPYPPRLQAVVDYIQNHADLVGNGLPMYYEVSSELQTPIPAVMQGLTSDVILQEVTGKQQAINTVQAFPAPARHFADVLAALMFVGGGGLDYAHNLVTPLSWGSRTNYAGPSVPGSAAAREAAYVHALIHRAEGFCDGEFGSGFSNANYWYTAAAAATHPISQPLLLDIKFLAKGKPRLEALVNSYGEYFAPSKFVTSCSQALTTKDLEILSFCKNAAKSEWHLLFRHCYTRLVDELNM